MNKFKKRKGINHCMWQGCLQTVIEYLTGQAVFTDKMLIDLADELLNISNFLRSEAYAGEDKRAFAELGVVKKQAWIDTMHDDSH